MVESWRSHGGRGVVERLLFIFLGKDRRMLPLEFRVTWGVEEAGKVWKVVVVVIEEEEEEWDDVWSMLLVWRSENLMADMED